jgi:hypothetical protein
LRQLAVGRLVDFTIAEAVGNAKQKDEEGERK